MTVISKQTIMIIFHHLKWDPYKDEKTTLKFVKSLQGYVNYKIKSLHGNHSVTHDKETKLL